MVEARELRIFFGFGSDWRLFCTWRPGCHGPWIFTCPATPTGRALPEAALFEMSMPQGKKMVYGPLVVCVPCDRCQGKWSDPEMLEISCAREFLESRRRCGLKAFMKQELCCASCAVFWGSHIWAFLVNWLPAGSWAWDPCRSIEDGMHNLIRAPLTSRHSLLKTRPIRDSGA